MSKKVLILSASARKGGNSERLCKEFAKGAKESGNEVEIIRLYDKTIGFCRGCLACQKTQKCVIRDDAVEIAEKMGGADVIAFATPVYYYSVSGQLKTMLDRSNPLFTTDYKFRKVYLLASAADNEDTTVEGCVKDIKGWMDCYEKAKFEKVIFAGDVINVGDIEGKDVLKTAFEAGKNIK